MNLNILSSGQKFVGHKIAASEEDKQAAIIFDYLMAGNGLFISATRNEFSVCLPIYKESIKGLPNAESGIFWRKVAIPSNIWSEILADARHANDFTEFKEDVFVVYWSEASGEWYWKKISKDRSWASTIADDSLKEYGDACIELHTHPDGAIHFSQADDRDEQGKFRIFAILTDTHKLNPGIRFRCGVYDYFFQIPAKFVSEMPDRFIDLNEADSAIRKIKK